VQAVVSNLGIAAVEYRCEEDPDVAPFVHHRSVEECEVQPDDTPPGRKRLHARLQNLLQQLPKVRPACLPLVLQLLACSL
jgi:ERCC4-related helicase